jgi:hypothetical protein
MGKSCNTHGGEEEWMQDSGGKARRKETNKKTRHRIRKSKAIPVTGRGGP